MIKHGPIDVVILASGEPVFDGGVLKELQRQAAAGTIRLLDAMLLVKDNKEQVLRLDLKDLPKEEAAKLGYSKIGNISLFDSVDANTLIEGMVPGSAIVCLAIEHVWAIELVNALDKAGTELAMTYRVPAPIADEAFALIDKNL